MIRALVTASLFLLGACTSTPPAPTSSEYADRLIARSSIPARPGPAEDDPAPAPLLRVPEEGPKLFPATARQLELAGDEAALDEFLVKPFDADDLAALALLRSDEVAAAQAKIEAARTGYRQAADLGDLVGIYRSFTRGLDTRVGPARHRRPVAALAPTPNVTALSGEIVDRTVGLAREQLRASRLRAAAGARRAHAAVAHRAESRRIVAGDVRLLEGLLEVVRAKLEAGQADQSGYLALSAEVARRRTELEVLDAETPALRASLNQVLARPENAPISTELVAADIADLPADVDAIVERALADTPAVRVAALRAERAEIAVRLAETMTLSRLDLGSSRFERGMTGEAGVDRGPVFPDPGKMTPLRADFGVREAQVTEMRARARVLVAKQKDAARVSAAAVRRAIFAVIAAERRNATLTTEIVPLAERSFGAARGAYEGNRSGYLDLLEAARRLVRARLDRAGMTRELAVARADLLVAAGFESEDGEIR